MPARFLVAFVPGVTPARWSRVWAERMPDVELELTPIAEADAAAVLHKEDGAADMVFARLPIDDEGLSVIPLWEESPVAVAAKDHPLKVVDAVTVTELADEDTVDGRDEAALDLVAAGAGIATMPQAVFRAHNRRDLVARPISDAEPTRIALVWREGDPRDEVDEFIGIVRGRTAASSRGRQAEAAAAAPKAPNTPSGTTKKSPAGGKRPASRRNAAPRKPKRSGGGRGR
ncbi:LysR family transcriptional regulator substrate-binding protein [Lysobacter korlensis]|uniref:LysR family transcriptional regulator substrate-binding protein n=1 Tax=Lysobacter korlensis TaxID=553636 RepID=A0ABV6S156_9GAMM